MNYDGSEVRIIHDISDDYELSFNETVYRVMAGCERFITMNGGFGILASYFGGENIIYCKESTDLIFNDFNRWYWRLGGSEIAHVKAYDDVIRMAERLFIKEDKPVTYFILDDHHVRDKVKEIRKKDSDARIVLSVNNDRYLGVAKELNIISSRYTNLMMNVYKNHVIL